MDLLSRFLGSALVHLQQASAVQCSRDLCMRNCPSNCKKTKVALNFLSQLHPYFAVILNLTWFSRKLYDFSSDLSFARLPSHTIEDKFPALEQTTNEQQTGIHRSEVRGVDEELDRNRVEAEIWNWSGLIKTEYSRL